MPSDAPPERLRRLQWQCRRGMLELDHLLRGFLDHRWADLDEPGRQAFEALLAQPDPLIHDWLLGYGLPPEPGLRALVALLREQGEPSPVDPV
jgi:antitoxin CptB